MDGQRLQPVVRRAAADGGRGRRPVRAPALVGAAFAPERRGAAIGILEGVTGLAVASGPLVGGAIADGLAWEWIFWLNVPIGLVAIPLALRRLDESHGPDSGLDIRGLALVTAAAFAIVWGLVRGNVAGWDSFEVLGALAGGALLTAAFVAWERCAPEPMIPLRFFRSRAFSAGHGLDRADRRAGMGYGELVLPLIVAGVGVAAAIPAVQSSVVGSVGEESIGKAAGTTSTMRELGGVFGIGVAAGLSLLGAAAGLGLPALRRPAGVGRPAEEGA